MGMDLYGASKAALNHMTRTFVAKLGETKLTVLSMHPGWVKTDMGGDQARWMSRPALAAWPSR